MTELLQAIVAALTPDTGTEDERAMRLAYARCHVAAPSRGGRVGPGLSAGHRAGQSGARSSGPAATWSSDHDRPA